MAKSGAGHDVVSMAAAMVGMRLVEVRYYTAPAGLTDKPTWDEDTAHVVRGLDLIGPDGLTGISWAAKYDSFGPCLQLSHDPVLTEWGHGEFWTVNHETPWGAVLGERVTNSEVHWLDVTEGEEKVTGPVALALRFADSISIVIVCGLWRPHQPVSPGGDDIVVLWQPDTLSMFAPFLPGNLLNP